jgi:hypothetical protein
MLAVDMLVKTVDCVAQIFAGGTSVGVSASLSLNMKNENILVLKRHTTGAVVADHDACGDSITPG